MLTKALNAYVLSYPQFDPLPPNSQESFTPAVMTKISATTLDEIPDGHEWGKDIIWLNDLVIFTWDKYQSSQKLAIEDDGLTIRVLDGSGFKNSIGNYVR